MSSVVSKKRLSLLRNQVPLLQVLSILGVPHKKIEGVLRFRCPNCGEMNSSLHPKENLGRCFLCKRNFNPIDLTCEVRKEGFLRAVEFLERAFRLALDDTEDAN